MPPRPHDASQAAPSLLALPPEVLLHILAAVPLADRLSRVALACRQLHAACLAPALISELDVQIQGPRCVQRTQALLRFLMQHGQHAHSLRLHISLPEDSLEEHDDVASLVAACLTACAARQAQPGGGLRQLSITPDTPLRSTGCLPLLTALQQLSLEGRSSNLQLRLDGSWRQLTALQEAHLSGHPVCDGDGPCLPPSLTRLCIEGDLDWADDEDDKPPLDGRVLAGLPALRCFELMDSVYTGASLAAVSGLTALTRLVLHRVDICPPTYALAKLAGTLRVLQVHSVVEDSVVLNSTVQALPGLETLALDLGFNSRTQAELQPATMDLPGLRCLCLTTYHNGHGSPCTDRLSSLPIGPYLSSLQRLALPLPLALAAHALLAQAPQLHTLCLQLPLSGVRYPVENNWAAFWQFVVSHPPLRRLLYEVHADSWTCPVNLLDALLSLRGQRPALEVRRLAVCTFDRILNPPTCWSELLDA